MDQCCVDSLKSHGLLCYFSPLLEANITTPTQFKVLVEHPQLFKALISENHRTTFRNMSKDMQAQPDSDVIESSQIFERPIGRPFLISVPHADDLESEGSSTEVDEPNQSAVTVGKGKEPPVHQPKKRRRNSESPERQSAQDDESDEEGGLLELLERSADGQYLKALFKQKGFDNKARTKLCGIVINAEFGNDVNTIISPTRLTELAKIIVNAFKSELESTYYVKAYTPKGGKTVIAKGKLYDKYTSLCKDLREVELRKTRPGQVAPQDRAPRIPETATGSNGQTVTEAVESALKFLKGSLNPWESVIECWKKTTAHRLNELLDTGNPAQNVDSYMSKYKCLKHPDAYSLLELDFDVRFPHAKIRIFSHWETFSDKVKAQLKRDKITEEIDSEAELLHKFVSLFSVCPVKVPKGKAWRASRAEILQGFLLHLKVIGDFERQIEQIYESARNRGVSIQPFPLVVGPTLNDINSSYIVIDKKPKLVDSPLRAFEIAFKCYFALHCEYPRQSQRQWIVIQKTLFDIHMPSDNIDPIVKLPEVQRLISVLKC